MTELEKAAEAREIDICQYSANDCLNTNGCHRCQWGVPSLDLRCSNNASFKLGAQWQAEQSPWIDINDISVAVPNDKVCLIRLENGVVVRDTEEWQDEYPLTMITHWMLIPECP